VAGLGNSLKGGQGRMGRCETEIDGQKPLTNNGRASWVTMQPATFVLRTKCDGGDGGEKLPLWVLITPRGATSRRRRTMKMGFEEGGTPKG